MKEKLKRKFVFIGLLSVFLTSLAITLVFYGAFHSQAKRDLRFAMEIILNNEQITEDPEILDLYRSEGTRVTLISPSGAVLYESEADKDQMDNHLFRPEIEKALRSGSGESLRQSETLGFSTYYYARRLPDGAILRLSMHVRNMYSIFLRALLPVLTVGILVLLLSVGLSTHLTRQLVRPIEEMAISLDTAQENGVPYEELVPFVTILREQQQKKEEVAQMRQEFTANVSHELKTPLTSISGYAEMIEAGIAQPQDIPVFAGKIRSEAGRMLNLIADIIKLSELDEREQKPDRHRVDLYELLEETRSRLSLQAEKAQITVTVEGRPAPVYGQRKLLEELVFNLCDNAIRYNRPGGFVTMRSHFQDGQAILVVSDTGIGIAKNEQERIFERFYRVDKSRSKETGGTGLGLAIVKHVALQHSAVVTVDSEPGVGTRITVAFPPYRQAVEENI